MFNLFKLNGGEVLAQEHSPNSMMQDAISRAISALADTVREESRFAEPAMANAVPIRRVFAILPQQITISIPNMMVFLLLVPKLET